MTEQVLDKHVRHHIYEYFVEIEWRGKTEEDVIAIWQELSFTSACWDLQSSVI